MFYTFFLCKNRQNLWLNAKNVINGATPQTKYACSQTHKMCGVEAQFLVIAMQTSTAKAIKSSSSFKCGKNVGENNVATQLVSHMLLCRMIVQYVFAAKPFYRDIDIFPLDFLFRLHYNNTVMNNAQKSQKQKKFYIVFVHVLAFLRKTAEKESFLCLNSKV